MHFKQKLQLRLDVEVDYIKQVLQQGSYNSVSTVYKIYVCEIYTFVPVTLSLIVTTVDILMQILHLAMHWLPVYIINY